MMLMIVLVKSKNDEKGTTKHFTGKIGNVADDKSNSNDYDDEKLMLNDDDIVCDCVFVEISRVIFFIFHRVEH